MKRSPTALRIPCLSGRSGVPSHFLSGTNGNRTSKVPSMASDLGSRWRRFKGFRLSSSKFSVLRLRLRLLGLIKLLKRCLQYVEKGAAGNRRRRRKRIEGRWEERGSRRGGLPEGKLWQARRTNSFSAEAIAECVEFIKRTSVSVDADAPRIND